MKKNKVLILFMLLCTLIFSMSFAKVVVIDPGHGGSDWGATVNNCQEKIYNLDIALKLSKLLKEKGVGVQLTRDSDVYLTLASRPQLAKNINADLFISLHNDWIEKSSYNGTVVLYNNKNDSGNKIRNFEIASIIKENLVRDTGLNDRGLQLRTDLAVLNRIQKIPAALVEVVCMTNPDDLSKLNNDSFRLKVAQSLCNSIIEVLERLDGSWISNKCSFDNCDGRIVDEWYLLGEQHYRVCDKNKKHHNFDKVKDKCKGTNCELCNKTVNLPKTTIKNPVKVTNKCGQEGCDGTIIDEWYLLGDQHYRICTKSKYHHNFDKVKDKCKGTNCELCRKTANLSEIIKNPVKVINKCGREGCDGTIIDEWYLLEGQHYRICTKSKYHHNFDKVKDKCTGVNCEICKVSVNVKQSNTIVEATEDVDYICEICTSKTNWIQREAMHLLMCEKDKTHVMKLKEHELDANDICKECGYKNDKSYQVKFVDYFDKNHWAWRHVGEFVEKGLVKGDKDEITGNAYLYPDESITAESVIVILSRVLGYDGIDRIPDETVYMPIDSIDSKGEWKYLMKYMSLCGMNPKKEMGILLSNNGISGTDEEIKDNYIKAISRERVAYLLGSFFDAKNDITNNVPDFKDWEDVNNSYKNNIKILSAYNVFRGAIDIDENLYIRPINLITRVEAISLLNRFYVLKNLGVI